MSGKYSSEMRYEPIAKPSHFKGYIKGKDLGLFNKVMDYLDSYSAQATLVKDRTIPDRRYDVIDILVNNDPSRERTLARVGLEMADAGLWDEKNWPLARYQKDHTTDLRRFRLDIDHCFVFESEDPKTVINLYFNTYRNTFPSGHVVRKKASLGEN